MKNRIDHPYVFSDKEQERISHYYHHSKDWDKSQLDTIKNRLRDFLRQEQDNTCCYCKQVLGFDVTQTHIEHIVSRNECEKYGFEQYNLSLSCPGCNTIKTNKPVLNITPTIQYSHNSQDYKIVHPYFDVYNQHIRKYISIYEALSSKGEVTIDYCKLSRLTAVEENERAYKALHGGAIAKIFYSIITPSLMTNVESELNKLDKILKGINNI